MQDRLIFKPLPSNVEPMKEPVEYGLKETSIENIKTEDDVSIHLWVKNPSSKDDPIFIVFHGNTGHFGDVGAPKPNENYDPGYRIKLLQEIIKTNAGFIAVSLRGFGKSQNEKPSEDGFIKDASAVIKFALEKKNIDPERIIILGESLGAAVAMIVAEEMTKNDVPPAIIAKISSFSSMKFKVLELHPNLLEDDIEKNLIHKFDSEHRIKQLSKKTHIYIAHPSEDMVTGKFHSEKLAKLAEDAGLKVTYRELEGAGHITWNPKEVIGSILEAYEVHKEALKEINK